MATNPFVPLNPNTPSGPTQAPPAYSASDLANFRAIRDMLVTGLGMDSWTFSQDGVSGTPAYYLWTDSGSGRRISVDVTYAGAPYFQPTQLKWNYTEDSFGTIVQIGPLINLTFNAATGVLTASSGGGGQFVQLLAARARIVWLHATLNTHTTANAPGPHGMGTLALQNANAVAFVGGTAQNITGTNNLENALMSVGKRREYPMAPPTLVNGANWDWSAMGSLAHCVPGITINGIQNAVVGEIKRLWVNGPGAVTINNGAGQSFYWAVGHPVWGANHTLINFASYYTNYIIGTTTRL